MNICTMRIDDSYFYQPYKASDYVSYTFCLDKVKASMEASKKDVRYYAANILVFNVVKNIAGTRDETQSTLALQLGE